ncbi:MAG TPA: lipocalin family protein [Bacteroidales bacterium]|nr:lipocalin family protein [Bacteroidales bacterium]
MLKKTSFFMVLIICFSACVTKKKPETVKTVDINKYAGKWYEIASFPTRFQKGCTCSTAEYVINEKKGYIEVLNSCIRNNKLSSIKGKAYPIKGSNNTKLKVQFFWPFKGDYWIIELDDNYKWAAVGSPKLNYLWILSRTPQMDEITYNLIKEKLIKKGFDVYKLVKTNYNCK